MIDRFYEGLTGKVVFPNNNIYNEARQVWNRSINNYPFIIVYCFRKEDIRNAIKWAILNSFNIRIRSGGHNYEGFCVGNKTLVIDVSCINFINFDEKNNSITFGPGVKNKELYNFVASRGYPFPSGTCPTVAVSGLTSGGGWGLSCRRYGLTCDSLIEVEMINYKGETIISNSNENKDLFFAIKGAGGNNFGVITSLKFKLPAKERNVTYIELYYPQTEINTQIEFFDTWQKFFITADEKITLIASIYNDKNEGKGIFTRGLFYGTEKEAKNILKPFLKIKPMNSKIEYMSFYQAINLIQAPYPSSEKFKNMNGFVYKKYNLNEIKKIVSQINDRPEGSIYTGISLYALGGKVKEVPSFKTAFYYRNSKYILALQSIWLDNKFKTENIKWVNAKFNNIKPLLKGAYINFPYIELKNYEKAYFGENVEKLIIVKKKYDPNDIFNFPQSIRV